MDQAPPRLKPISNGVFLSLARQIAKNRGGWRMIQRRERGGPVTVTLAFRGNSFPLTEEQADFVWLHLPRGEGRNK